MTGQVYSCKFTPKTHEIFIDIARLKFENICVLNYKFLGCCGCYIFSLLIRLRYGFSDILTFTATLMWKYNFYESLSHFQFFDAMRQRHAKNLESTNFELRIFHPHLFLLSLFIHTPFFPPLSSHPFPPPLLFYSRYAPQKRKSRILVHLIIKFNLLKFVSTFAFWTFAS